MSTLHFQLSSKKILLFALFFKKKGQTNGNKVETNAFYLQTNRKKVQTNINNVQTNGNKLQTNTFNARTNTNK